MAGRWHGKALVTPPGTATRPTAERLRQALFDMLLHAPWSPWRARLDGAVVLDAFAGTGALGLEALSRGAARATFMERDRAALTALRRNVASCAGAEAAVLACDALRPPPGHPSTLVFLDPPYGRDLLGAALSGLAAAGWIAPDALLIAESAVGEAPGLGALVAERTHGAGRLTVWRL